MLSCPNVVEWRFSLPAPRPTVDETPASVTQEEPATATTTATRDDATASVASSRRRSWLRRRLAGLGGGGRVAGGGVGDRRLRESRLVAGVGQRDRGLAEGGVRRGVATHYVASLLPAGPNRTKVFARCVRVEREGGGLLSFVALLLVPRLNRVGRLLCVVRAPSICALQAGKLFLCFCRCAERACLVSSWRGATTARDCVARNRDLVGAGTQHNPALCVERLL